MKIFNFSRKHKSIDPDGPDASRFSGRISESRLREIFADCYDMETRCAALKCGKKLNIYFIDGLTSGDDIAASVIRPLVLAENLGHLKTDRELAEEIASCIVFGHSVHVRRDCGDVVSDILNGYCAVMLSDIAVTVEVKTEEKRSISEPGEEKVLKGAKDSFVETVKTNSALVRRHLRCADIRMHRQSVGRRSDTSVVTVWIDGLTNPEIPAKLISRIGKIDIDGLITSSSLEEYISDSPRSAFPQLIHTERPDKFCMNLLEGRVGILADGLPMGFIAPATFAQFFKVPEDRAEHFLTASLLTLMRYAACFISLFLPAIFTAIAMYHQEMLPTKLLESMIAAKQSVPFPVAAEVIMMLLSLELLQEAGMRLPSNIGQTVSIIGALIVGQSAVEAKVVSPIAVIIIALSGISGYTVPDQDMSNALRIWRFLLLVSAIAAGMFGIAIGASVLLYHLCTLESVGVPYLTPAAGKYGGRSLLQLLRPPLSVKKTREEALRPENGRLQR